MPPCLETPEREATFTLGHRPALDGLRGLAVLAVMAYHSVPHGVLRGGFLGVEVFFALSGFLVTAVLLQEYQRSGSFQLLRFYGRRALRLFPALLLMLGVCCIYAAFRTKPERAHTIYRAALLTACYAANAPRSAPMDLLGHAWSLSLEGQFYLLWPLLLSFLWRNGAGFRVTAGLVVLGLGAVAATPWMVRADAVLAGCVVGLLAFSNGLPRSHTILPFVVCLAAVILIGLGVTADAEAAFMQRGGFTVAAASAAVVVAALIQSPASSAARVLSHPVLLWIGRISYGLYLWHFPMLSIAPKLAHGILPASRAIPGLDAALAFGAAFAAAALSYYAVERPCLRWKNRLFRPANAPSFAPANGCGPGADPLIWQRPHRRRGDPMTTIRVQLDERSYDILIVSNDRRGLGPFARTPPRVGRLRGKR